MWLARTFIVLARSPLSSRVPRCPKQSQALPPSKSLKFRSQAEDVVLVLKAGKCGHLSLCTMRKPEAQVWATRDTPPFSKHAEKRHVGEARLTDCYACICLRRHATATHAVLQVRIPLRHLSDLCNCMLYFTWACLSLTSHCGCGKGSCGSIVVQSCFPNGSQ